LVRALPNSDVIALSPPFVVTEEELGLLADRLRAAIMDVVPGLKAEGLI